MEKRNIIIFGIFVLILIVFIILLIFALRPKPEIGHEYFTLEPETWVRDNKETEDVEDVEINLFKATRGKALVDLGQEDYHINGRVESFFYYGSYKGNDFQTTYLDESFDNLSVGKTFGEREELTNELAIMRITNIIKSNDEVIEGFILGKEENNRYSFYVFADEDWKNNVEFTNILWGDNFNDPSTIHVQPFDFSKSEKGIYINEISQDIGWFKKRPREGGIIVGEVDKEILSRLIDYEEVNVTYIMVR